MEQKEAKQNKNRRQALLVPDNPSLDVVLDRFMQLDQAPSNAIDFRVTPQKKRKREEQDNEVQGQLVEEVKSCRTVKDMFSLRDKYLVLLQDYTNKTMKGSQVLEKGKAKCVLTSPSNLSFEDSVWVEPISRHKDICFGLTLKLDSEHDHRLGNNNGVYGGCNDGWFWDEILEDGYTQGVLMEPISKSKDVLYDSTLIFESDRNVFDTHHGNINGGEGSSWCKDWEDGKAQCALMQPISPKRSCIIQPKIWRVIIMFLLINMATTMTMMELFGIEFWHMIRLIN
ncbi:hypothetical protein ACE6H2_023310 [Prunus campanulata]